LKRFLYTLFNPQSSTGLESHIKYPLVVGTHNLFQHPSFTENRVLSIPLWNHHEFEICFFHGLCMVLCK